MPAKQNDLETIKKLKENFYQFSQEIIEKYYLKPLSKDTHGLDLTPRKKDNLKDGVLERLVHGGMHVGRAQFWVTILHKELKKILPDEIQNNLTHLSAQLGLSEDQIITLICYVALFHDSARQHEAQDEWDKESAQNAKAFFEAQGLSTELADIFSQAAALKNKPEEFGKLFPDFQYIRELVYLADCFEIMRCSGCFSLKETLRGFSEEKHGILTPIFIDIAKQIYQLLRVQEDMLEPCVIVLPNNQKIDLNDGKSHFSIAKKIKFEHADNVCSVLCESIKTHTRFAPYLADEALLSTELSKITPAFNPYIHGTNSSIFSLLKRTKGRMMPTLDLLNEGIAPMTGEIENVYGGGGIAASLEAESHLCFGRLDCAGHNVYNFSRVSLYADTKSRTSSLEAAASNALYYCEEYISPGLKNCFEKINGILVYVGRAKQLGIEAFEKKSYQRFKIEFNALIQLYYLYLLIDTHIHPKFNMVEIEKSDKDLFYEIVSSFDAHLTYEKLIEKIIESKLNIKDIYANPTQEGLQQVLDLLKFPAEATITISTGWGRSHIGTVTLKAGHQQMFSLSASDWQGSNAYDYTAYRMQSLLCRKSSEDTEEFLSKTLWKNRNMDLKLFKNLVLGRIKKLEEKMALLEKIYMADSQSVTFTAREKSFLIKPFPVILVCSDRADGKIHISNLGKQEYLAYETLQLGEDIDMIATDTIEHQHIIMTFLKENNIDNVQVVLMKQLEQSLSDHAKPAPLVSNIPILVSSIAMGVAGTSSVTEENRMNIPLLVDKKSVK